MHPHFSRTKYVGMRASITSCSKVSALDRRFIRNLRNFYEGIFKFLRAALPPMGAAGLADQNCPPIMRMISLAQLALRHRGIGRGYGACPERYTLAGIHFCGISRPQGSNFVIGQPMQRTAPFRTPRRRNVCFWDTVRLDLVAEMGAPSRFCGEARRPRSA